MDCHAALAGSVTALAVALSRALPAEDAAVLAAVLTQLGDTLGTLAALQERQEACLEKQKAGCLPEGKNESDGT